MNDPQLIPQQQWEEIEQFLLQKMTTEEEERFRERLLLNPELNKTMEEIRLLSIGIQESSLLDRLNHFHEELAKQNTEQKKNGKLLSMKRWVVAASIFFVLFISGYFFFLKKIKMMSCLLSISVPIPDLLQQWAALLIINSIVA